MIAQSARVAIEQGLIAIVCVGEDTKAREAGETNQVLHAQLAPVLSVLSPDQAGNLVIAYEPIWAIGTGQAADAKAVSTAHQAIRKQLQEKDAKYFNSVRIIYGGSVKPANAAQLLAIDDVHGLLIGGASLDSKAFSEIGQCK